MDLVTAAAPVAPVFLPPKSSSKVWHVSVTSNLTFLIIFYCASFLNHEIRRLNALNKKRFHKFTAPSSKRIMVKKIEAK